MERLNSVWRPSSCQSVPEKMGAAPWPLVGRTFGAIGIDHFFFGGRAECQRNRIRYERVDHDDARAEMSELAYERPKLPGYGSVGLFGSGVPVMRPVDFDLSGTRSLGARNRR